MTFLGFYKHKEKSIYDKKNSLLLFLPLCTYTNVLYFAKKKRKTVKQKSY